MAASAFPRIGVMDLGQIHGSVDQSTAAAQLVLASAVSAVTTIAQAAAPRDDSMMQLVLQLISHRRSGSGPTPAPALPPTSTLTR